MLFKKFDHNNSNLVELLALQTVHFTNSTTQLSLRSLDYEHLVIVVDIYETPVILKAKE